MILLLSLVSHSEKENLLSIMFFFIFISFVFRYICIYLWFLALGLLLCYKYEHSLEFTISSLFWLGFLLLVNFNSL